MGVKFSLREVEAAVNAPQSRRFVTALPSLRCGNSPRLAYIWTNAKECIERHHRSLGNAFLICVDYILNKTLAGRIFSNESNWTSKIGWCLKKNPRGKGFSSGKCFPRNRRRQHIWAIADKLIPSRSWSHNLAIACINRRQHHPSAICGFTFEFIESHSERPIPVGNIGHKNNVNGGLHCWVCRHPVVIPSIPILRFVQLNDWSIRNNRELSGWGCKLPPQSDKGRHKHPAAHRKLDFGPNSFSGAMAMFSPCPRCKSGANQQN